MPREINRRNRQSSPILSILAPTITLILSCIFVAVLSDWTMGTNLSNLMSTGITTAVPLILEQTLNIAYQALVMTTEYFSLFTMFILLTMSALVGTFRTLLLAIHAFAQFCVYLVRRQVHPLQLVLLTMHVAIVTYFGAPQAFLAGTMTKWFGLAMSLETMIAGVIAYATGRSMSEILTSFMRPSVLIPGALATTGILIMAHYMLIPTLVALLFPVHFIASGLIMKAHPEFHKSQIFLLFLHAALLFAVLPASIAYTTFVLGSTTSIATLAVCQYRGITLNTVTQNTKRVVGNSLRRRFPTMMASIDCINTMLPNDAATPARINNLANRRQGRMAATGNRFGWFGSNNRHQQ